MTFGALFSAGASRSAARPGLGRVAAATAAKLAVSRLSSRALQERPNPTSKGGDLGRRSGTAGRPGPRREGSHLQLKLRSLQQEERRMAKDDAALWKIGPLDSFPRRHIGPDETEAAEMLGALEPPAASFDEFVSQVIPADILSSQLPHPADDAAEGNAEGEAQGGDTVTEATTAGSFANVRKAKTESEVSKEGIELAARNELKPCFIGEGYHGTLLPEVIKRDILQNPAWYTSYTPYQPEISQGRLESLLNFQTMVSDLTGLPIANASLLDAGTAAAEAMTVSLNALPPSRAKVPGKTMLVSDGVLPRTILVMESRARGLGVELEVMRIPSPKFDERVRSLGDQLVGVMVQYPTVRGGLEEYRAVAELAHRQGVLLSCATDLLALTVLTPPGEWGADIAFGNAQRFGVPMGFGGPHAAFFAVAEAHKRRMPGRLVGVSRDRLGGRALRLALQTREQHIRREKATSNVCTSQALLANVSAMYAVYHGPDGLRAIAESVMRKARYLQAALEALGYSVINKQKQDDGTDAVAWDTVLVHMSGRRLKVSPFLFWRKSQALFSMNRVRGQNGVFSLTVDETHSEDDINLVVSAFAQARGTPMPGRVLQPVGDASSLVPAAFRRTTPYLTHPVFNTHHSETELMRYMHHLESKDLSLVHSMIPLGSCTMKLNGAVEMRLITLPGFSQPHPMLPVLTETDHGCKGYYSILKMLSAQLRNITGMDAVSLQPNSGAQGEFAGLRAICDYHESRGDMSRDVCLIPVSAHGTNPASAAMAGLRVVPIKCDVKTGNLDMEDLEAKCREHQDRLAAIMITYPSTFGVFEPHIRRACELVHNHGGQVYMDGANMNAQIGLCSPGDIGADVCHLNLHKTFCIPHGGGGPGAGPICAKSHLGPFLPETPLQLTHSRNERRLPVSSATFGSASILPISWAYNTLMGSEGLRKATVMAILNANYLLSRLRPHYSILYTNDRGRCAHEFILDARPFRESAGVEAIDIAKRLQDYGFHAPTMSWPVANTLMIEPTESESKDELDRFADALISIRAEIRDVEEGRQPRAGNVLKMAPHPLHDIIDGDGDGAWERPYSRQTAAYPLPWLREKKFWPTVARIDDTYGDMNLFCTCPSVEEMADGQDISSVQTTETK